MQRNGCDASSNSGACGGGGGIDSGSASSGNGSDGCIYPDQVIAFNVRYTGCVEVTASMKSMDTVTRTLIARECIHRACEAAGLKSVAKRRVDKKIAQFISDRPCMQNAGTNVIMNVSSRAFSLINVETGEMVVSHNMARISCASGGDLDTLDFVAYIAKNEDEWRACYVVECISGQSEDLIWTIGKMFMMRSNELTKKSLQLAENYNRNAPGKENDKDYYNDLPNKLPPDLLTDANLQQQAQCQQKQKQHHHQHQQLPQTQQQHYHHQQQQHQQQKVAQLNLKKPRDRLSSNLIDLNSPPPDQTTNKMNLCHFDPMKEISHTTAQPPPVRDVFDITPLPLSGEVQRSQLMIETWFHAAISRPVAESLVKQDGDFLVRESQGKLGQYVLTGLEGKTPKHLLLIDPEGVVRTKDRIFDSISHLINYHWTNSLPIISEDSELVLRNPVLRQGTHNATGNNS